MPSIEILQEIAKQAQYAHSDEAEAKLVLEDLIYYKINTLTELAYLQLVDKLLYIDQHTTYYTLEAYHPNSYKLLCTMKNLFIQLKDFSALPKQAKESLYNTLQQITKTFIHNFDILYHYAHELLLYSNILERRYRTIEIQQHAHEEVDYQRFYQDLEDFVFHSDVLGTINDKMKAVMEKLPLSLTKNLYFDLLSSSIESLCKEGSPKNVDSFLSRLQRLIDPNQFPNYENEFELLYQEIKKVKNLADMEASEEELIKVASLGEALGSHLQDLLTIIALGYEMSQRYLILLSNNDFDINSLFTENTTLAKYHEVIVNYFSSLESSVDTEDQLEGVEDIIQKEIDKTIQHYSLAQKELQKLIDLFEQYEYQYDSLLQQLFSKEHSYFTYMNMQIFDQYYYTPDTHESISKEYIKTKVQNFKDEILSSLKENPSIIQKEKLKSILKFVPPLYHSELSFMNYVTTTLESGLSATQKLVIFNELAILMDQYGYFTPYEHHEHEHHDDCGCGHDH